MKHKSTPVNSLEDETESEEEGLLVKRKRTKFLGLVQAQEGVEFSDMVNKVPDSLPLKVYACKEPKLVNCAVQSSGEANGCSNGLAHGISFTGYTGNEPARSRLPKICTASGWKEPSYDFEEQGPPHNKLFRCKVTVYVESIVNTVMECFSDLKHQKKAAQEHAAQGALWCLEHYGHVK